MKQNGFTPLFIIFLFFVVSGVVILSKEKLIKRQDTSPTTTPVLRIKPSVEKIAIDGKEIQKVTANPLPGTNYIPFTLEIPSTWQVSTNSNDSTVLHLEKGFSSITIGQPAIGGGVCVFADTDRRVLKDTPFEEASTLQKYTTITLEKSILRRVETDHPENMGTSIYRYFSVCEIDQSAAEQNLYSVPTRVGTIYLNVDRDKASSDISEMDQILSTLKY